MTCSPLPSSLFRKVLKFGLHLFVRSLASTQVLVCVCFGTLFLSRTASHISTQDAVLVFLCLPTASGNSVARFQLCESHSSAENRKAMPETRGILASDEQNFECNTRDASRIFLGSLWQDFEMLTHTLPSDMNKTYHLDSAQIYLVFEIVTFVQTSLSHKELLCANCQIDNRLSYTTSSKTVHFAFSFPSGILRVPAQIDHWSGPHGSFAELASKPGDIYEEFHSPWTTAILLTSYITRCSKGCRSSSKASACARKFSWLRSCFPPDARCQSLFDARGNPHRNPRILSSSNDQKSWWCFGTATNSFYENFAFIGFIVFF